MHWMILHENTLSITPKCQGVEAFDYFQGFHPQNSPTYKRPRQTQQFFLIPNKFHSRHFSVRQTRPNAKRNTIANNDEPQNTKNACSNYESFPPPVPRRPSLTCNNKIIDSYGLNLTSPPMCVFSLCARTNRIRDMQILRRECARG